jgi:hypothetical protein
MMVQDAITGTAGEALSKYRLVKLTGDRTFKHCQPGEQPLGVNEEEVASAGNITVELLTTRGTFEIEAYEAISQNAPVWPGPDGYGAASGVGAPLGYALVAATAQGNIIEVLPATVIQAAPQQGVGDFVLFDDFAGYVPENSNEATWDAILTDSGTVTLGDAKNGVLVIAASDGTIADNDEAYVHSTNELFLVEAAKPIYFETRVKLGAADSDGANVMVGLLSAPAANAILDNGGGPPASYSGVVVYKVDGGSAWQAEASVAGTQQAITLTSPGAPGTTFQKIGILIVPTSSTAATVYVFVDGSLVGSGSFTFTSFTEACAFVGVKNGGGTVNTTLHVDYVLVRQAR